jgi:phosphoribosyl 1,2-cyclic phosphodiesterase
VKVKVWGCRGSLAVPGADTVRYGGNTSCVEVRGDEGEVLVLDAGTGMRPLGLELVASGAQTIHVLLSHLHLDHLQGLGFFRPLFESGADVHIWGPASPVQSLAERIATYLSPPLFPVRLADIPATVTFHDAPEQAVSIGSLSVRASLVTHQGPTVGYRIESGGRSIVYLPDHEPSLGGDVALQPTDWISGYELAHAADVLLHDAQYGDDEYPSHIGWGHSAIGHVVAFAQKAMVDNLVLFHHDPAHTDVEMEALVDEARRIWGDGGHQVCSAWDGMTIDLDAGGISLASVPGPVASP